MKFRGRLKFVQYNPSKRSRFGIKFYKLCESKTGYCLKFKIYTGKEEKKEDSQNKKDSKLTRKLEEIVLEFIENYKNQGHTLYLDNWYSSPDLFLILRELGFNVIGTVRQNIKNLPRESFIKLEKGETQIFSSNNIFLLRWSDKKIVNLLSTKHSSIDFKDTKNKNNKIIKKPKAIIDYNNGMGGINLMDQYLANFPTMRRYLKGYKKIFFI